MRLKLYILTTLISSIIFVNCSKVDEDIDNRKAILFSSTAVKADWTTRGSINNNILNPIGVMAFSLGEDGYKWTDVGNKSTPNLMYNSELKTTESGLNWNISPTVYWMIGYISFFAYSPRATTGENNGITLSTREQMGVPIITYRMPELAENQPALMLAAPQHEQTTPDPNAPALDGIVRFEFKHALAAVGFEITNNTGYSVESIGIKNIIDIGVIKMMNVSNENPWINPGEIDTDPILPQVQPLLHKAGITPNAENTIYTTSDNGYLMVIPQDIPANAVVIVKIENESNPRTIDLPDNKKWIANKQYIYQIVLNSNPQTNQTTIYPK